MLRMCAGDMLQAQQQIQRLHRIERHARTKVGMGPVAWEAWRHAMTTQQLEQQRCGVMLAVNFEAANDGRTPPHAA